PRATPSPYTPLFRSLRPGRRRRLHPAQRAPTPQARRRVAGRRRVMNRRKSEVAAGADGRVRGGGLAVDRGLRWPRPGGSVESEQPWGCGGEWAGRVRGGRLAVERGGGRV